MLIIRISHIFLNIHLLVWITVFIYHIIWCKWHQFWMNWTWFRWWFLQQYFNYFEILYVFVSHRCISCDCPFAFLLLVFDLYTTYRKEGVNGIHGYVILGNKYIWFEYVLLKIQRQIYHAILHKNKLRCAIIGTGTANTSGTTELTLMIKWDSVAQSLVFNLM
jgi:hypothetical protein